MAAVTVAAVTSGGSSGDMMPFVARQVDMFSPMWQSLGPNGMYLSPHRDLPNLAVATVTVAVTVTVTRATPDPNGRYWSPHRDLPNVVGIGALQRAA